MSSKVVSSRRMNRLPLAEKHLAVFSIPGEAASFAALERPPADKVHTPLQQRLQLLLHLHMIEQSHSASSAKSDQNVHVTAGPKSSHKAEPNSANSRIRQRWQNPTILSIGMVATQLFIYSLHRPALRPLFR